MDFVYEQEKDNETEDQDLIFGKLSKQLKN